MSGINGWTSAGSVVFRGDISEKMAGEVFIKHGYVNCLTMKSFNCGKIEPNPRLEKSLIEIL